LIKNISIWFETFTMGEKEKRRKRKKEEWQERYEGDESSER
jgi:hypothetical protein